jgi:hypothetical protein
MRLIRKRACTPRNAAPLALGPQHDRPRACPAFAAEHFSIRSAERADGPEIGAFAVVQFDSKGAATAARDVTQAAAEDAPSFARAFSSTRLTSTRCSDTTRNWRNRQWPAPAAHTRLRA